MNSCATCKHWQTNDYLQRTYGEGEGRCDELKDITFCDKHNCILYENKEEVEE